MITYYRLRSVAPLKQLHSQPRIQKLRSAAPLKPGKRVKLYVGRRAYCQLRSAAPLKRRPAMGPRQVDAHLIADSDRQPHRSRTRAPSLSSPSGSFLPTQIGGPIEAMRTRRGRWSVICSYCRLWSVVPLMPRFNTGGRRKDHRIRRGQKG